MFEGIQLALLITRVRIRKAFLQHKLRMIKLNEKINEEEKQRQQLEIETELEMLSWIKIR